MPLHHIGRWTFVIWLCPVRHSQTVNLVCGGVFLVLVVSRQKHVVAESAVVELLLGVCGCA